MRVRLVLTQVLFSLVLMIFSDSVGSQTRPIDNHPPFEHAALEYLEKIPLQSRETARGYTESGYWTPVLDIAWYALVAWSLMRLKVPHRCLDFYQRRSKGQVIPRLLVIPTILLIMYALTWPLNLYDGFYRETVYGISNQSLGQWMIEHWISVVIATLIFTPLLLLIYAFMARIRRGLWVWLSAIMSAFMVLIIAITPLLIDPISNEFTPIPDDSLRADILSLASENGIEVEEIYTWNTSEQSTAMSAKVTGVLGSAQISISDNLLYGADPAQVRMVVAHEMGHLVMHHNLVLLGLFVPVIVLGTWLLLLLLRWILDKRRAQWGIEDISDVRALPILISLYFLVSSLMLPAINGAQRYIERKADRFALDLTKDPETFVQTLVTLPSLSKSDPGLVEEFIFFDHPSKQRRIEMGLRWQAGDRRLPVSTP